MLQDPIIVTAGPTYEPIDAVRFIGNRSSGRMGIAIATAAHEAGHRVILMLGPGTVEPPPIESDRFEVIRFRSCADLESCLEDAWPDRANTLIMAAAVADFRPKKKSTATHDKLRREDGALTLELESTPDLVAQCAARRRDASQKIIAFALEPEAELDARAAAKLQRKRVNAIVANPLETMDADGVRGASIIWSHGKSVRMPTASMSKSEFARWLLKTL